MPVIDSDAHVCEPKDLFTARLPAKFGDAIPRARYVEKLGGDYWFVGDNLVQPVAGSVIYDDGTGWIERREEDFPAKPKRFEEQHPSSWDPNERVKVMDAFGIQASTTYPYLGLTSPTVYKSIPGADASVQLRIVEAYNDWILSWAQQQPGRFIPLAVVPYWDVPAAVAEIERCAEIGIKGLVMSGKPQNHGYPLLGDRHWDPVWSAAQDAGFSISFHSAGGGTMTHMTDQRRELMGYNALLAYVTSIEFFENAIAAGDLLMSGVLQRFPRLHFAIVESGCGWVPFLLEALDEHYKKYRPWRDRPEMRPDELPSDLFNRQVFVNIWFEQLADKVPIDNVMFETDYPHPTCLLGDEIGQAMTRLEKLNAPDREKILWQNALKCFNLKPSDVGLV